MKKLFVAILLTLTAAGSQPLIAQDQPVLQGKEPVSLTADELFVLSNIPLLTLPPEYQGPDAPLLPQSVDNSTQPYFRPITSQTGYECGQSAGIAFNFTYEIDRLRGVPANVTANQYPTHFTWDFLNFANNYQGVSFFDSWEIVRACGNMNVFDYGGGLNTGGYMRWISGYDKYYNGMQNRLNYVRAIRADDPEGLLTLKYWLYDHLEGAMVGGVGNIYGQYFSTPATVLPSGTPEAGKYVQTAWGGSPSHAWTICGFNDSIRYDFNGDGQYTNNLDINSDGVVNMKDWEKGGLKLANGYSGTGWSNQGFCYTMYKNIADNAGFGGIWNHTIYVIDVKQTCTPKLTMKVTLKHTSRNKLKVTAGLNTDLAATTPSFVQEFPIFNFQGGDYFMQGGSTEADKTIEFGLDLTPMLSQLSSGQAVKYFLQVQENDGSGVATGEIVNWSLIDYTGTAPVYINYPSNNTPLANNTTTRLSINHTVNFSKPSITTATLPPATLYQPYNFTLQATNGTSPYLWDARLHYPETTTTTAFPTVTAQQLTLTNNNSGYAVKTLDFEFPFYKKGASKVYVYVDGYILFDDQPYTYPYLIDKMLLFRQTNVVAPFMADLLITPSAGQGIWYEGNSQYAIFRWKTTVNTISGTALNFAVKIYPTGTIEYFYGDMQYPTWLVWTGGLSGGDNKNYQYSAYHSTGPIPVNTLDHFQTCGFPIEMEVTEDGHFTGTPAYPYQNLPITFRVTDNNNISSTKVLNFNIYGLLIDYEVVAGGDSLIEFGETAAINLTITNIGATAINNLNLWITGQDPYITLLDSTELIPVVNGGQTLTLSNVFSFEVDDAVPDQHPFTITMHASSQEQSFQRDMELMAHAPVFHVTDIVLVDGDNGTLDPGESCDMLVTFKNQGTAKASAINVTLTSVDPYLAIDLGVAGMNLLKPDSSKVLTFHVHAAGLAPFEHVYRMQSLLTANNNFTCNDSLFLFSGEILEDFETGDFTKYSWYPTGAAPWIMETVLKYQGNYSARSGAILDNNQSTLSINTHVLEDGEISFYKYVSCEADPSGNHSYDYLCFYIDNVEVQRWDGTIDWSRETFPVTEGYHLFTWSYVKDYSVSSGLDGAILDNIRFPLIEGALPQIQATPPYIEKSLEPDQEDSDSITVTNTGGGILRYSVMVFDTASNKSTKMTESVTGSYIECYSAGFVPGQAISWTFVVHNQSSDNENVKQIKMDFPPGVIVNSATNFSGGSLGDMAYVSGSGNAASVLWHGEITGGTGVLKPGETASAMVTGVVDEALMNDAFVVYDIRGDGTQALPHQQPGHIKLTNYGLASPWVTLTNTNGNLFHNETAVVPVSISSAGLTPGDYRCNITVRDMSNNIVVIPVILHVTDPVTVPGAAAAQPDGFTGNFPNPFTRQTSISFILGKQADVSLGIYNAQGTLVMRFALPSTEAGPHTVNWNGKDAAGRDLPSGIYTCRMTTDDFSGTLKMILIR